ncbi:MAG: hypothetical protein RIB84_24505 [Sneathiellaceae bacterium]
MIVCLCNGHNDREIRAKAAELGSTCPVTVYAALQGPPRCGRCLDYAGRMLGTGAQHCRNGAADRDTTGGFVPLAKDGHAALA